MTHLIQEKESTINFFLNFPAACCLVEDLDSQIPRAIPRTLCTSRLCQVNGNLTYLCNTTRFESDAIYIGTGYATCTSESMFSLSCAPLRE